ncbi:unnamed protein product [Echinostoma caproni]|uniref:COMM domain-containing protein n=1 Tax=Echinostoma caproni TaxID=27848 RepID=A0A182ZZW0_9TREM|nr:unnamed protein product [Echinostoma caproni]
MSNNAPGWSRINWSYENQLCQLIALKPKDAEETILINRPKHVIVNADILQAGGPEKMSFSIWCKGTSTRNISYCHLSLISMMIGENVADLTNETTLSADFNGSQMNRMTFSVDAKKLEELRKKNLGEVIAFEISIRMVDMATENGQKILIIKKTAGDVPCEEKFKLSIEETTNLKASLDTVIRSSAIDAYPGQVKSKLLCLHNPGHPIQS